MGRRAARLAIYPAILGGSVLSVVLLSGRLGPVWAMNTVNAAAAAVIVAAERVLPYRRRWGESRGDLGTDLAYAALSVVGLLLATPLIAAFAAAAMWLAGVAGVELWPTRWPLAAQLPLALLLYELGSYGFHHLSHHTRLWRLHAVHHSSRRLYWFNSLRSHPIDYVLAVATTSGPLLLLGAGAELFALVTVFGVVNMWLQHANIDARTGVLDWIFVTPRIHRWHHSQAMREQQCNLGAILIVWDVVFGSRLAPADREPPEDVGPGVAAYPDTFLAQLASPFRRRMWRGA